MKETTFISAPQSGQVMGSDSHIFASEPAPLGGGGRTIRFGRCRVPDLCRLPFCPALFEVAAFQELADHSGVTSRRTPYRGW